ncbi:MAG: macro domain-containing protein [Lachnospiraceae bacterium]|nr:macro domain-containing protein [Lachnospiraceae bacterium]
MSFKIVRNDITRMETQAIVNTANTEPVAGTGCDHAVYQAAGYEKLLDYRKEHIGAVPEGEVFITPGFDLPAEYIIHAVSPLYIDGEHGEEELLRSCYRKSLDLAAERGIQSIAFPLISTGGFGYPREEGMRIAVDEIHAFLLHSDMEIYLVVFDDKATSMGRNLYAGLEEYISRNYVDEKRREEYGGAYHSYDFDPEKDIALRERRRAEFLRRREEELRKDDYMPGLCGSKPSMPASGSRTHPRAPEEKAQKQKAPRSSIFINNARRRPSSPRPVFDVSKKDELSFEDDLYEEEAECASESFEEPEVDYEALERKLRERMSHRADTFSQYLLYLIERKGMENADVYKRAIIDKKVFSKIKNNPEYHPQKLTALCLCIGAKLNLDESRDLLARAGYALSPSDKTDIIFTFFIENKIYDMIELDIQLEEHGIPCIIT